MKNRNELKHYPYIVIFSLIFIINILFIFFIGQKEYEAQRSSLQSNYRNLIDYTGRNISSLEQQIILSSQIVEWIPNTSSNYQRFITDILNTSQSSLLSGVGLWFEENAYPGSQPLYAAQIIKNFEGDAPFKYTIHDEDYTQKDWYKKIINTPSGSMTLVQVFDGMKNRMRVRFGTPFLIDNKKSGILTFDLNREEMDQFFLAQDLQGITGFYITNENNTVIYANQEEDLGLNRIKTKTQKPYFMDKISIDVEGNPLHFYFFMDKEQLYKRMEKPITLALVTMGLWLLVIMVILSRRNYRKLNGENTLLKEEIRLRKAAESKLQYLAYHDPITDLPNLKAFMDEISVKKKDKRFLVIISPENIQKLTGTLDKNYVDTILWSFSAELSKCHDSRLIYRGVGFHFYLIAESEDKAHTLAKDLSRLFKDAIHIKEQELWIKTRIGICPFHVCDNMEQLISKGNLTLSQSNHQLDNILLYTEHLEKRSRYLRSLESMMKSSFFPDQLIYHYQPIVNIKTQGIVGYEMLSRWQPSFQENLISPIEFIPLAEENGQIISIGWQVIRKACQIIKDPKFKKEWFLSINISPLQFLESGFAQKLDQLITEEGIPKDKLKLEITESSSKQLTEIFQLSIDQLVKRDFHLSMDDFGTGESSIERLRRVPFKTIKFDKSFISNIEKEKSFNLLKTLVLLVGETLDTQVIIEGIDSESTNQRVLQIGGVFGQGYYYSPPRPFEEAFSLEWNPTSSDERVFFPQLLSRN
ncbi:EAL domain-containing protein [Spirochaeta cellobiosiphila]|uniref:EAL domain-containing protein n=1 Tax=Spirochaeta cellobiosiphila TaxID=504483 RepID=UPI000421D131|nr:EAL domain-containing protein [Spirochaeta cellobiosiphila]